MELDSWNLPEKLWFGFYETVEVFFKAWILNKLISSNQVVSFKFFSEFRNWTQKCLSPSAVLVSEAVIKIIFLYQGILQTM